MKRRQTSRPFNQTRLSSFYTAGISKQQRWTTNFLFQCVSVFKWLELWLDGRWTVVAKRDLFTQWSIKAKSCSCYIKKEDVETYQTVSSILAHILLFVTVGTCIAVDSLIAFYLINFLSVVVLLSSILCSLIVNNSISSTACFIQIYIFSLPLDCLSFFSFFFTRGF